MLVLAAPLILLYFLSVGVSWLLWRARGKKAVPSR
jgi:Sec-independent protein secretion pathway component TatC